MPEAAGELGQDPARGVESDVPKGSRPGGEKGLVQFISRCPEDHDSEGVQRPPPGEAGIRSAPEGTEKKEAEDEVAQEVGDLPAAIIHGIQIRRRHGREEERRCPSEQGSGVPRGEKPA